MAAAQNVTAQLSFNFNCNQLQTTGSINAGGSSLNELITQTIQFVTGNASAAYNIDQLYAKQLTIASTTTTIHLQTATQNDPFGNTLAMLRVRAFVVQNVSVTSGFDCSIASSASDGVTWLAVAANQPPVAFAGGMVAMFDPLSFSTAGMVISSVTDGIAFTTSHTVVVNVVALGCTVA